MAVGEWDQRQLCPDGGCVGVIGPDGTCKVCGRAAPNWGDERKRGLVDPDDDEDEDDEDDELAADADEGYDEDDDDDDDDDEEEEEEEEAAAADEAAGASEHAVAGAASREDWTTRQLCPDDTCIGLIGHDGRCKVCGRAASDAPHAEAGAAPTGPDSTDDNR